MPSCRTRRLARTRPGTRQRIVRERLTGNASRYYPPRPDPPIEPIRALRILWVQARQLHAPVRAVDELELANVHPHVSHARSGASGQQQDITRTQGVDYRRDLGPRARLIAAHARQPNAVLAVGVLNQSRAIESVVSRAAPNVGRSQRFERRLHHVARVAGDRYGRQRRWQVRRGAVPTPPASPCPPPQSERHPERRAHAVARVVAWIPEPSRAPIFEAIAQLASQGKPGERPPFEPASHGPLRGKLLSGRVGGESQGESRERVGSKRGPASSGLHLVTQTVEGPAPAQGVVHEEGESQSMGERSAQPRRGPELVDVGAIAVVPAPEMELQPPTPPLRPERSWEEQERREPPGLSQPRQQRAAPPTCVAPCDGTGGAGLGA